jgi:hypothetical protein
MYRLIRTTSDRMAATAFVEGYPAQGHVDVSFIEPPQLITATTGSSLHAPIEWVLYDHDVWMVLYLYRGQRLIWAAATAPNATTMTMPAPPSSVDPSAVLGSDALDASLWAFRGKGPATEGYEAHTGPLSLVLEQP